MQQVQANWHAPKQHMSLFSTSLIHALLGVPGDLDAPTLSYAFHTAFVLAGIMLHATASDLDLLGGHVLVRQHMMLASHSKHNTTE